MPEVLFAYAIAALLVAIVFVIALVLGRAFGGESDQFASGHDKASLWRSRFGRKPVSRPMTGRKAHT